MIRIRKSLVMLVSLALISGFFSRSALSQESASQNTAPDPARLEAQFEAAFEAALQMPQDTEPIMALQGWGSVMMMGFMAENSRWAALGEKTSPADAQAASERILARLEERRPESGLPHLLRLLKIQDQAEKRAAITALADRFTDDPIVIWQAAQQLRSADEFEAAMALVDRFAQRNPSHPLTFRLLDGASAGNETQRAEILQRWAQARPGDPLLVSRWLDSEAARRDQPATAEVISSFFADQPSGATGLAACLAVLRRSEFKAQARACIGRISSDPNEPASTAERAQKALLKMAADEGDFSGLLQALDELQPAARVGALIRAAEGLKTPTRCDERIELLLAAADALEEDDAAAIASALRPCAKKPAARNLLLDLLATAPAEQVNQLISRSVVKVNGRYRGDLPPEAIDLLLRREASEPPSQGLYRALDIAMQALERRAERLEMLQRWYRRDPDSLPSEQTMALAMHLGNEQPELSIELLRAHLDQSFSVEATELLWQLLAASSDPRRADSLAAELISSEQPWRLETGHLLSARTAASRQDIPAAQRHYEKALGGDNPRMEVAIELLRVLHWIEERQDLEEVARGLCTETRLADSPRQVESCVSTLLVEAGDREAAATVLSAQADDLPANPEALRERAAAAGRAGRLDLQEAALRKALEIDAKSEHSWTGLGVFLEKTGQLDALLSLYEESQQALPSPHLNLARSTARALTAAGQPRRALDILLAVRAELPKTNEWALSWVDHESDQAYRALGKPFAQARSSSPPKLSLRSAPEPGPGASPHELRLEAHRLQSGAGGLYDPETAFKLYQRAADRGDAPASFRIALLHHMGLSPSSARLDAAALHSRSRAEVLRLAQSGDAFAQYLIGSAAMVGLGDAIDDPSARRWLEAAAAGGESWAWHNLAYLQQVGRGGAGPRQDPKSRKKALDGYRRAAQADNARSMLSFAALTLTHGGSGALCDEGLTWLKKSAEAGHANAAALLGKLLFYGRGRCVAREPSAAMRWLEAAAAAHQPGAKFDLALARLLATDAEQRSQGLEALRRIAAWPDGLAVETLAFLRATGEILPRDPGAADRWLGAAAGLASDGFNRLREERRWSEVYANLLDKGIERLENLSQQNDAAASAMLARLYAAGFGSTQDQGRVLDLARQAAKQGRSDAMRILSQTLRQGESSEADIAKADRWRQGCAVAGDSFCMMSLAQALIEGEDMSRDLDEGVAWLIRAAEAGNWWAVTDLAKRYDRAAPGMARDPDKALAWKRRLADSLDPEALGWLEYHDLR